MKRLALLLLLAFLALAIWLAARGCGADAGDPVERLVAEMVPIPGRDFRMGKYEVTQAQWEAVMGGNPSRYKGADHPVECVSWNDCQAFLEKLNAHPAARASGLVFRLPTAEEWEFACRAGSTNDYCRLADGTEITEATLGRVAWFGENTSTRPRWLKQFLDFVESLVNQVHEVDWKETPIHHPMGRKAPNAWGLHDIHGNVWEWTETAAVDVMNRVTIGGSCNDPDWYCATSYWNWYSLSYRRNDIGFRLCATPSPAASESHAENAESAEFESHAENAESAEFESHAENAEPNPHAESAEVGPHAESAEGAEFGSPAGGAGERSEPEGVSHEENHLTLKGTLTKISSIN